MIKATFAVAFLLIATKREDVFMHYAVKDVLTKIDRMVPSIYKRGDNSGLILDPHCKVERGAHETTLEVIEKPHGQANS